MPTIKFHQFANGRAAFAEVVGYATLDVIARLAKKKSSLASKGIEADYDRKEDGSIRNTGTITAGTRRVARFTVYED